jgi:RecQ family ATP-dependent DNA helicase
MKDLHDILTHLEVDVKKVEKGLKAVGLNLSKFQGLEETIFAENIDLLNLVSAVDPVKSSKRLKLELRTKLDKIIGRVPLSQQHQIKNPISKSTSQTTEFSDLKSIIPIYQEFKLGKVKFFDATKGFGYIHSIDDGKDCFIHISQIVSGPILENDLVILQTRDNKRKPGELEAFNVSNRLPVYCFTKETASRSIAIPLLHAHFNKEYVLNEKIDPGFYFLGANQRGANWNSNGSASPHEEKGLPYYIGEILKIQLLRYVENKSSIEFLQAILNSKDQSESLREIYHELLNALEQKTLSQISNDAKDIELNDKLFSFCKNKTADLDKLTFLFWLQDKVERLPIPTDQAKWNYYRNEILTQIDGKLLNHTLKKLFEQHGKSRVVEETYRFILESSGWEFKTSDELMESIKTLKGLREAYPDVILTEGVFHVSDPAFHIPLFVAGILTELSSESLNAFIDKLQSREDKVKFIERLTTTQAAKIYSQITSLSSNFQAYIHNTLKPIFEEIDYICFDLESDGEQIQEYAWETNTELKSYHDFKKHEKGIAALIDALVNSKLVVGQNVKEFDLPILKKQFGAKITNKVWDTLEIEMLLTQRRFSYGLKATHSAVNDTTLTSQLFKNQLLRIATHKDAFDAVRDFIPTEISSVLKNLRESELVASIDRAIFETHSDIFFRPNPLHKVLPQRVVNDLQAQIDPNVDTVVIAPKFLWEPLSHNLNLNFLSSNERRYSLLLGKSRLEEWETENHFLKTVLKRYLADCSSRGIKPYVRNLPKSLQAKLTPELESHLCKNDLTKFKIVSGIPSCIAPEDVGLLKDCEKNVKLVTVGQELYSLTSKLPIGDSIDFTVLFERLKHEPIWLQMSGGKSFISLEEKHCTLLGITDIPDYCQNIWLEKTGKGKFQVWCNIDFEGCLRSLQTQNVSSITWNNVDNHEKSRAFVVRPDAKRFGYIAEQRRVNPESLNRKLYWTYQFKLFESISSSQNPKVLIVNDETELVKLSSFARSKGYFIPDPKATLQRQLEILHRSKGSRLLIKPFDSLSDIIASNYLGPIDLIWDSFLLHEKLQMLRGKAEPINVPENDLELDDHHDNRELHRNILDQFSLIALHKPLIDFYYQLLLDNSDESRLFLCDSRFTDFHGIEKSLQTNAVNLPMWFRENEYEGDVEISAKYFSSKTENASAKFDVNEAKEILRNIFLQPEGGGKPYEWHDYQHPCLDQILPAKHDLLISLPTGAGKSLLFQGPALFRAGFSCKLSLVISPLRALMQDQVDALWNKGFYSNVEFLSGDKSQGETRDIYRRVAGGEITLLYITPERFRSRAFESCLLTRLDSDTGLEFAVFDEAHCISQWGQEFRPDYLNAGRKIAGYADSFHLRKLLFSATISEQVFQEISQLMPGIVTVEGTEKSYNPVRDHIKMDFKHNVVEDDRLREICNYLKIGGFNPEISRAIVFVKSRKKVEECALVMPDMLKEVFGTTCTFAEKVGGFHAGMDSEDRKDTYEKYKNGEVSILFATKAFGMGMDIPNIHFVTHYSPPSTFEDFLQEIGRAGRNEKQRTEAGFDNKENPIKTLCLTAIGDFAKLKDQLHESRISWHEVKDIKLVIEEYISRFKKLVPDNEVPVAIPFNLYSTEKESVNDDLDNKFRIALHWLERLERIKLGYFTITHLEFESKSIAKLAGHSSFPDKVCEQACRGLLELLPKLDLNNEIVQISIAELRGTTKLSLENLFAGLLAAHRSAILVMRQDVVIEPTKIRSDETNYCASAYHENQKYPAIRVIFSFARQLLAAVPLNQSKMFEGAELDEMIRASIQEVITFSKLPWSKKELPEAYSKELDGYVKDIVKKRSKHAFTILRSIGKITHETKIEKVDDSSKKVRIIQSIFNGYHKKDEWASKLKAIEKDAVKVLDFVAKSFFEKNNKVFNWAEIITKLDIKGNVQYLSDLLFVLSVLGYTKTGGLLPSGIEVYLNSIEPVNDADLQSRDKKIHDEFDDTRKVRELKLIVLEVLSNFHKASLESVSIRKKQDEFIRRYFACSSLEGLLQLLQDELPPNDPLIVKWRGDAIKNEEEKLNSEQRIVYSADINQHINVMAGPGSGKTHTLTLRVAKLVHHIGVAPEQILVLAYNRAVVSELKERLGKLFSELGYGNLSKRIKIFTFHGLAKKYCQEEIKDRPFDEWEDILLRELEQSPGKILNHLAPLKHILVDEFQDINEARIRLLNKLNDLTGAYQFIIGDPNQSIYGYERIREGGSLSPWPYYNEFDNIFKPAKFNLFDNHRSYPDILKLASGILTLPRELAHLIPRPTRQPDKDYIANYTEVIDRTKDKVDWWTRIEGLTKETIGDNKRAYRQIAILFRTNNEVYRGFQKIKSLSLPKIRIRIQGSLPYEFSRIRECHAVIHFLKKHQGPIPTNFSKSLQLFIKDTAEKNQNWNHFYLKVTQALVLEFLEEGDENQTFSSLIDFIGEVTHRDDGQLYKIYEKHLEKISNGTSDTEIVLTTMHKVKGLEFDCVVIPPSFSNLPLKQNEDQDDDELDESFDEERRLAFVAYTRARFRLIVFKHLREKALESNTIYKIPSEGAKALGVPVYPEIKKLKIGWAAKSYNFSGGVNGYIGKEIRSGDIVFVKKRIVLYNGTSFNVYEIFKENSTKPIGELSSHADFVQTHSRLDGYIVNEVVVWTFEDTCRFDNENNSNYAKDWCQEARQQGFIYLVDFAGYGLPQQ